MALFLLVKKLLEIIFYVEDGEKVGRGLAGQEEQGNHKTGMTGNELHRVNK